MYCECPSIIHSTHSSIFIDFILLDSDDGFYIPCILECPEIREGLESIEALRKIPPSSLPPLLRQACE